MDAVQTLKTQVGPLNVLVNNAAVYRRLSIEDMDVAEWDRLMAVNVRGVMLGTKAAVPVMREAGGGSIVNMSSTASYRASYAPHYGASKGAVLSAHQVDRDAPRARQHPLQLDSSRFHRHLDGFRVAAGGEPRATHRRGTAWSHC